MLPYVLAIVFMSFVAVVAIVTITLLRPHEDNLIIFTMIIGFLSPSILSLMAFLKAKESTQESKEAKRKSEETHSSVNSRLDKWVDSEKKASHLAGVLEGESYLKKEK